jgi:hypothetical protein
VDGRDGYLDGEARWRKEVRADGELLPEVLECGWNVEDVERRWREELGLGRERIEAEEPRVKMSVDAGRFLCDFIFYQSLSLRWKEGREMVGKVCFLHVPGETDDWSVRRGARVAAAAAISHRRRPTSIGNCLPYVHFGSLHNRHSEFGASVPAFQWALITYFVGPYSILLHNHIHGRGLLSKSWALVDTIFPYILGPMMGQTWNSFYYHYKHHHIEDNGPENLSSTLRYQRDSVFNLALYISRLSF